MNQWVLFAIIIAVAVAVWFFLHKKKVAPPAELIPQLITPAPGVIPSTGQIPPNAPPPIPAGMTIPPRAPAGPVTPRAGIITAALGGLALASPNAILSHVPLVGGITRAATKIGNSLVNSSISATGNILSHVPIVGNIAAAPVKAVGSLVKSLTSWL